MVMLVFLVSYLLLFLYDDEFQEGALTADQLIQRIETSLKVTQ